MILLRLSCLTEKIGGAEFALSFFGMCLDVGSGECLGAWVKWVFMVVLERRIGDTGFGVEIGPCCVSGIGPHVVGPDGEIESYIIFDMLFCCWSTLHASEES